MDFLSFLIGNVSHWELPDFTEKNETLSESELNHYKD